MADYDLSGLSSRSFEQLIQAIATRVIGPGIVIFGDGPDGGREATFDGAIPYPDRENGWQGYGVIQAKFRQRPQGSRKDGKWALQQLRSELEKFVDPERDLRKPEYYVLATNVVLTPVQDQGSKDKVYSLIQEFKEYLPLKEYDVWDYDKICRFLDGSEDIRRAYAAWITPGDVLAKVIDGLEPRQPDFEEVVTNFLQKELLADQYANLEQAGHAAENRIPLTSVFVDLLAFDEQRLDPLDSENSPENLGPGFIAEILNVASERLDPKSLREFSGYQSAKQEISRPERGRFVLIGGPGQGKTTIGQFICQLFRTAILKKRPRHLLAYEVRQTLKQVENLCRDTDIWLPSVPRFPIRILLSDFAAQLASKESNQVSSLLSCIVDRIHRRTDREISVCDFRQWLRAYPWIIILDGLDEVPASSNRDEVLAAVHDFWIDAAECNADVLVVATTRPQGYNEEYAPHLYQHRWLAPLSGARAMHYACRLAEVRYGNDQDRYQKVIDRIERASGHEATARLMRSPLQVTIMTTLVDRMGQPPRERWNLFKEYYNVIYQREMERDIPAAAILREYKPDIDAIHNRLGLLLQVESERSGRTDACISSGCFAILVEARLVEEGHEGNYLDQLKRSIIEAAMHRLVFLVGLKAGEVGFEIRSLQEFMAAEGLMEGDDEVVRKRLREIAPVINWRNVFLFAAGKCFVERQHLRDTIYTICAEMNEDIEDEVALATLAGSQLALDLLEDGSSRRQPKYARSLVRLALRLLDLPPVTYRHIQLADLYAPAMESVYREELKRHLIQSNPVHRLAAWASLITLAEAQVPWAQELASNHWPDEEDDRLQLLQVALKHRDGSWAVSRLVDIIPQLSPSYLSTLADERKPLTGKVRDIQKPTWLDAISEATKEYIAIERHRMVNLRLPSMADEDFFFTLGMLSQGQCDWLIPLKDLPNPCSDWLPFVCAGRFLENPSSATLAQELRLLAQDFAAQRVREAAMYLPWPMGACMAAASNQQKLLRIADRAEAGELGDIEDWKVAEERWLTHGVVVEDLYYMTDERWPYDDGVAGQGFPFAAVGHGFSTGLDSFVQGLLDLHMQLGSSHARATVADCILYVLGMGAVFGDDSDLLESISFDKIRILATEASLSRDYIARALLTLFDTLVKANPGSAAIGESTDFWDYLGMQENLLPPSSSPNHLTNLLSDVFCRAPTRVGVLRLLSLCVISGASPSIPLDYLDPHKYSDSVFREAAILVKLTQGGRDQDDARALARFIAELIDERPDIDNLAMQVLSAHRISGPYADRFLLELRRLLPVVRWKMINQTVQALNESLSRRTSCLGNPRIWSALRLPKGLNNLIRE